MDIERLGRLHIVEKGNKEWECRVCSKKIEKGILHFKQNIYGHSIFGLSTRVCFHCGEILKDEGCEIVKDLPKAKKIKKEVLIKQYD